MGWSLFCRILAQIYIYLEFFVVILFFYKGFYDLVFPKIEEFNLVGEILTMPLSKLFDLEHYFM